jgi:bacteriophage exclusion system BrxA-like protein
MTITEKIRYSSKIIKAGALLADTKTLLSEWDESCSVAENRDRFRRENLFGKASRSRVEDILAIFRQRYLADPELLRALIVLARANTPAQSFDRILYLLALRNDPLLHDVVLDLLLPLYERGQQEVGVADLTRWVRQQVAQGLTERTWGQETIERVAQGVAATLRDFGVLQGVLHKRITPPFLPIEAFCFIALLRSRDLQSGERLLRDPEWRLFLLPNIAVERMFVAAHQEHLLEYYAAGRVMRIEFPTLSLEEYARALAQRSD